MQRTSSLALIAALVAVALSGPASAQNRFSFISFTGNDGANCLRATPCRTLAGAFAKTNAGGQIDILDTAGYGPLTITKAISIVNNGNGNALLIPPTGGAAITINAGPGDLINLQGLTIDGEGRENTNGIVFNSGKSLTIRNCLMRNNGQNGLYFKPNNATKLSIVDSIFESNLLAGGNIEPSGPGILRVVISGSHFLNGTVYGLYAGTNSKASGSVKVSIFDTVTANNGDVGIYARGSTVPLTITIMNSASSNNGTGVSVVGNATMRIGDSLLSENDNGWTAVEGGKLFSYFTNQINGNAANEGDPPYVSRR